MYRLLRIFVLPREVFNESRGQTSYALPLWSILIVGFVCLWLSLMTIDDVTVERMLDDGTVVSSVSFERVLDFGSGPAYVGIVDAIWTFCILLVWTSYFWVASKVLSVDIGWRQWLGFTSWTALPDILGSIADICYDKYANVDLYITFSSFPLFPLSAISQIVVYWIPISLIWTLYIAVNGVMSWTERSLLTSLLVVLPSVVAVALLQFVPGVFLVP